MNLEKFIITSINSKELLTSLSKKDKNSFGVRILKPKALALEALNRNNITIDKEVITNTKQIFIIYNILKNINYFKSSTFKDAKNITTAINYSRMLCRGNEENKLNNILSDGEFKEKNISLLKVYTEYKKYLKDNNLIDDIDIINLAINNKVNINSSCIVFKEDKLDPLYEELVNTVFKEVKNISILDYLNVKCKNLKDISYTNAYGAVNEIEHILDVIAANKIPLDNSVITLIDTTYIYHLLPYINEYNIPVTYGIGLPITLFNAGKVLNLLYKWDKGYNGVDSFRELVNSYEFNDEKLLGKLNDKEKEDLIKTIGYLRLNTTYDEEQLEAYKSTLKTSSKESKKFEIISKVAKELGKGYSYIIRNYTKVDTELDNSAINKICTYIEEYMHNVKDHNILDIKEELFSLVTRKELSKEGCLHITDLKGSLGIIRSHNFICGLGAKVFPGAPKENYLLLDSDLERFKEENVKTSINKVNDNKELLFSVLDLHNSLDSKIHISYSGFNLSELKEENPSSLVFEIFKKESNEEVEMKDLEDKIGEQVRYFTSSVSSLKDLGEKYINGVDVKGSNGIKEEYTSVQYNQNLSPSAADKFIACPKRFYLKYILGLEDISKDDPSNSLPINEEGTLIHECMKDLALKPSMSFDEFMINAENKIDKFFLQRKPLHKINLKRIKSTFLRIAETGFKEDPHKNTYLAEEYLGPHLDKDTGINLGGYVDKIEEDSNKYSIVDYKTGRKLKHEEDDPVTCFQVLLYAYILEQEQKKQIEGCEYRYLRSNRVIKCVYNDDIKKQLKDRLQEIKDTLEKGEFITLEDKDTCKYCVYKEVCGRDESKLEQKK